MLVQLTTVAVAAVALLGAAAPAFTQVLLHSASGGLDQPAAESALQPVSGFGSDNAGMGMLTGPSASDGLRLQFDPQQPANDRFGLQFFDPALQPAPTALEGGDNPSPSLP